jgi:hypothetical protein
MKAMSQERVYSASLWAQLVKKQHGYACATCGERDDVLAIHITPPSLGGRNVLSNGTTRCLQCQSKPSLTDTKVRFNFSVPHDLFLRIDRYCGTSGRSINDVIKQIIADFTYDDTYIIDSHGEKNDRRVSVPILKSVFEAFTRKCKERQVSQSEAVKSLLYVYLEPFEKGAAYVKQVAGRS